MTYCHYITFTSIYYTLLLLDSLIIIEMYEKSDVS